MTIACLRGDTTKVSALLAIGVPPNSRDHLGVPAIIAAAEAGPRSAGVVRTLLKNGARPNVTFDGMTPLMMAVLSRDDEAVKSLLRAGAKVDSVSSDGDTALVTASYNGDVEAARLLIANGANVNHANSAGITPLIAAASSGETAYVALLLAHAADTQMKTKKGYDARDVALRRHHLDIVKLLDSGRLPGSL